MAMDIEILKQSAYFAGFTSAEIEEAAKPFFEQSYKRGEIIAMEAEPADNLYIVASGVVKLFKTSAEGKEQILYLAHTGDSFNYAIVGCGRFSHLNDPGAAGSCGRRRI